MLDKLKQDQVMKDIMKLAEDYISKENVTDPQAIIHVMNGIRIGMVRGLEIAESVKK